jgi:hypothetical protein
LRFCALPHDGGRRARCYAAIIGSTNCLRADIDFSIGNDVRLSDHGDTGMIAA